MQKDNWKSDCDVYQYHRDRPERVKPTVICVSIKSFWVDEPCDVTTEVNQHKVKVTVIWYHSQSRTGTGGKVLPPELFT